MFFIFLFVVLLTLLFIFFFFFFNDTATTEIYTLSLHDALPIHSRRGPTELRRALVRRLVRPYLCVLALAVDLRSATGEPAARARGTAHRHEDPVDAQRRVDRQRRHLRPRRDVLARPPRDAPDERGSLARDAALHELAQSEHHGVDGSCDRHVDHEPGGRSRTVDRRAGNRGDR